MAKFLRVPTNSSRSPLKNIGGDQTIWSLRPQMSCLYLKTSGEEQNKVSTPSDVLQKKICFAKKQLAAWPSGSERCSYDGHDRKVNGSTPTQSSLLRPWIRYFTTIIFAWWNLTSSKLKKSEVKFHRKTRKQGQLLNQSRFVLCIAPPRLSRDRRIKMKK